MATYKTPILDINNLVPTVKLGTGTASSANYLRGDSTWAVPSGGGGGDPPYSPGSFTVITETSRTYGKTLKLATTNRATIEGTSRLRVIN